MTHLHLFIHNSFHNGDVVLTKAVIQAVRVNFTGVKITLECTEKCRYLWRDLELPIIVYQGSEYTGTEPTEKCPDNAVFLNMWFGVFDDILTLHGMTYQNNVHTFNRQMYQHNLHQKYLLQMPIFTPMVTFFGKPGREVEVREKSILVENGQTLSNQNYFYLNEHLKLIASNFPNLNFYCSAKPFFTASNIFDCSELNLIELSSVGDKCIGFLMRGSAVNAATQTEVNRYKPRCIVGWDLPMKVWDNLENPAVYAENYAEVKEFLLTVNSNVAPQKSAFSSTAPQALIVPSIAKKPQGIFLNTAKANCSIHESGKMAYQSLLVSDRYDLDYLEIDQNSPHIPNHYEFYFFNYHHATMSWLNTKSVRQLPGVKVTLVLETLTNNPFVLCPADDFDAYCALDPTMNVVDKRVYALPRPLEAPTTVIPYHQPAIPIIGSFGFATPGKGFELVVDAVNKEFDEAIVKLNIPSATYADDFFWKLHKRNYADYLSELCRKVAKNSVQIIVSHDYMTKGELIEWCSQNTLNCFLYNRNQPGLSATTDQAIASGRALAISANETFRHIHPYIKPYPFQSLRESIASSQVQVMQMQKDWTSTKFAAKFEEVLEDFSLLSKTERQQAQTKVTEQTKATILIVSHKEKQCGIYQYGVDIAEALQKSSHYSFIYAECSNQEELHYTVIKTSPAAIIYNYYSATMPWLTNRITWRYYSIPQLGIMHEVTQEEADKVTHELFDYQLLFDYHLCPDPTLVENKPIVFKTRRLIQPYINSQSVPDIVTIGSFGFGFSDKGFERLLGVVQEEFDQAKIVLHLPFNDIVDKQGQQHAIETANRCRSIVSKPGIQLFINHEFLSKQQLLNFLASNTLNAFFYDTCKYRGISKVIDYALAVQRPIAITNSGLFRHISSTTPSICIENSSLKQIIQNGISPLVKFNNEWSEANFILSYENIFKEIFLRFEHMFAKQNDVETSQSSMSKSYVKHHAKKSFSKFLNYKSELDEATRYLKQNGYVSHRLVCKNWALANIIFNLSDGNLLDMGSADSYLLKNAVIKGIRGEKYGIDLQEPDVPVEGVNYIIGDLMDTGLPCNFFQNITCLSVIEHEVDIKRFANEVSRVLVKEGKLYLTFDYWTPKVSSKLRIFEKGWNIFDQGEIMNLIEECKTSGLNLIDEVDWSLGKPIIDYWSPDPKVSYTFGMLVFKKDEL